MVHVARAHLPLCATSTLVADQSAHGSRRRSTTRRRRALQPAPFASPSRARSNAPFPRLRRRDLAEIRHHEGIGGLGRKTSGGRIEKRGTPPPALQTPLSAAAGGGAQRRRSAFEQAAPRWNPTGFERCVLRRPRFEIGSEREREREREEGAIKQGTL